MKAVRTRIKIVMTAALAVIFAALCVIYASADEYSNTVRSVKISGNKLEIKIKLTDYFVEGSTDNDIYIIAVPNYIKPENADDSYVIGTAKLSEKITFRTDFSQKFINSRFFAARKTESGYSPITDLHCADNPDAAANYRKAFPKYRSPKGLSVSESSAYADSLYPSHTVIDVDMCKLMLTEYEDGCIEYVYEGTSRYYDGDFVRMLDKRIKEYTERGICVYLRILLSNESVSGNLRFLYAQTELPKDVRFCAPDMDDEMACLYIESMFSFLASRYYPGGEHGFAASYIIGTDVNSNRCDHYFGEAEIEKFTENYEKELRTAYNITRSVYANSRVYVSVGPGFNARNRTFDTVGDPFLDYSSKELLTELNTQVKKHGNFGWHIAADASPSNGKTDIWNDMESVLSEETPFVTVKNIDVLISFMAQSEFKYEGKPRRVIIDRFSIPSENESSGDLLQAAAYAYAYYKICSTDTVDALIYSQFKDDGGSCGIIDDTFSEKEICNVIKYIDSNTKYRLYDTAPAYMGGTDWNNFLQGSAVKIFGYFNIYTKDETESSDMSASLLKTKIFDFETGNKSGFKSDIGTKFAELKYDVEEGGTVLHTVSLELAPYEMCTVSCEPKKGINLSASKYISARVRADCKNSPEEYIFLTITSRDGHGKTCVFDAKARIKNAEWTDVYFDISDFSAQCGEIYKIEISASPCSGTVSDFVTELSVSDVSLYNGSVGNSGNILLWAVLILFAAAVIFVIIKNVLSVKNRNKQMRFDIK